MIKENEIRINNYYNGGIELVGSLQAKLNANEHNDFQLTRGHFEALCGYTDWLKFINPIPLTEEWLERFGFLKRDDGIYSIQYEDCFEDIQVFQLKKFQYKSNGFEYRSIYSSDFHGKIEHVHDLQNKFNSASGEELTQKIK